MIEHDLGLISTVADPGSSRWTWVAVVTAGPPAEVLEHPDVITAYLGTGTTARDRSSTSTTTSEATERPLAVDTKGSNQ